jgi:uncharacterized Fe-S cluster-containing radical SAM superfamily protein
MALPKQPITLSPEQVEQLNRQLSTLRHDINNQLSLIVAAMELLRHKPEVADRMLATVSEQPARIGESIKKFTGEFEAALQITRP